MEKIVEVKSSSNDDIYKVTLKNINGIISLNCTCKAGFVKQKCKHRISLLNNDYSNLVSESDIPIVQEFLETIEEGKLEKLFSDLVNIETEIEKLTIIKNKISKNTWIKFSDGF